MPFVIFRSSINDFCSLCSHREYVTLFRKLKKDPFPICTDVNIGKEAPEVRTLWSAEEIKRTM